MGSRLTKRQSNEIKSYTDDHMDLWLRKSHLPKHLKKWFVAARDEALKSNFHSAKVGCVLVYKNHIVGRGHNQLKTDPTQKRYNRKYRSWTKEPEFSKTCGHIIHAELDALKSIPYAVNKQLKWGQVEAYIYRVAYGLDGYSGLALPCHACAHALNDSGVKTAFYTTGHQSNPFGVCDI